jgi:hypothetical protein
MRTEHLEDMLDSSDLMDSTFKLLELYPEELDLAVSYKVDVVKETFSDMTYEERLMFICFVLLAESRWPF